MTTRCKVCQDLRRPDVDHLLAAGKSARSVAIQLGLPIESMKRHARMHVVVDHGRAGATRNVDPLDELLASLKERAMAGRDASMVREYRLVLAAQAAQHAERPAYDVVADPEWIRIRSVILDVLRPHPELLAELVARLKVTLE